MRSIVHRINANGLNHFVRDTGDEQSTAALLLHGFPDSHHLWDAITPLLAGAGFRVIAPDMRGFGETDMARRTADYDIQNGAVPDVIGILDALGIDRAHLVGHDFGAPVAWAAAAQHPQRFLTLTALSVGHPRAYLAAGLEQKTRSLYILFHQFRGLCEAAYRLGGWALLRRHWSAKSSIEDTIAALSRPGRLTAGLNWYRANMPISRMLRPPAPGAFGEEIVRLPTLGVWSAHDPYLTEAQMTGSAGFVTGPWRYARIDHAGHWIPSETPDALAALLLGHWSAHLDFAAECKLARGEKIGQNTPP